MKLLLTSAGIKNTSIANTLVEMLGKPIAEASALVIPTAAYPAGGPAAAWRIVSGRAMTPLCEIGWNSSACSSSQHSPASTRRSGSPSSGKPTLFWWAVAIRCTWRTGCGSPARPTSCLHLQHTVWVGVSAGSLAAAPRLGQDMSDWQSPTGSVQALGLVDFSIFPHLDHPNMPEFGLADAERWAAALDGPGYAIDDQTAITVIDGEVAVVSEGHWKLFD